MKKNKFGKSVKYYKFNYDIFKEDKKMEEYEAERKELYRKYRHLQELHNDLHKKVKE